MYKSVRTKDTTLRDSIREDIEDGESDVDTGKFIQLKWIELVCIYITSATAIYIYWIASTCKNQM